ncbi:sigma-70 family RNA polymerase sigma factor [Fulvivirga sp. 29W222]|uniref:Sigma-70 family RNA polymerase sigma factor n=1 Tax=Fulvivirga marina TaxID=2494733 RepID=A0A937FX33_9BACT|nr:sigma-70 family RNA polymerase sigma factor [Fulvivirga marina]MBL6446307.1 sigma-70 family RNA polymerase sigma factor [Fulvivirga marina]
MHVYKSIFKNINESERLDLIDQKVVDRIKAGDDQAIIALYDNYRKEFLHWCYNHYSLQEDESADVFQDAVIIFYNNVKSGKLEELSSSLKTYLFGIGKNLALKRIRQNSKTVASEDLAQLDHDHSEQDPFEATERQHIIAEVMNKMGDPCQSILRMFYFDKFTMDAIASRLGYKNEHVVKSQKLRCFNQLKKMISERFNMEDL